VKRLWLLSVFMCAPPVALIAQGTDRCRLELEQAGLLERQQLFADNENWYGSGGVRMRCHGQEVFLRSDSAVVTKSGQSEVGQFIDQAQYRDEDVTIDADTLVYFGASETLQVLGNVVILTHESGATLTSQRVDYLREAEGVRDTAETVSPPMETRVRMVLPVNSDDSLSIVRSSYVITSDGLRRKGEVTRAWGGVTVDRDSLAGRGDTLVYVTGDVDEATLIGAPARFSRTGADSFSVAGTEVVLSLDGEALNSVVAHDDAEIRGTSGDIFGPFVSLTFSDGLLDHMNAWGSGRGGNGRLVADGYDIQGDSIVVESPAERLKEIRVFGNGMMLEPFDSTVSVEIDSETGDTLPPIQNRITGSGITASFVDYDSSGTIVSRLSQILATGSATSLFSRDTERNGENSPTINYTRADTIIVVMLTGDSSGVSIVRAYAGGEPVDGIQLEKASLRGTPTAIPSVALPGRGTEP
jgi:hypothetical protein